MSHEKIRESILRLLPADGSSIGNGKMQALLAEAGHRINEQTYFTVRDALVSEGQLTTGRGRGGSIMLATQPRERRSPHRPKETPAQQQTLPAPTDSAPPTSPRGRYGDRRSQGSAFEQVFKNIDDVLWKEAGCSSELDYTEQASWLLFLKYLDDLEQERAMAAELMGRPYQYLLDETHRWNSWAAPKTAEGSFDHDRALTGDDLLQFVNFDLFPYLQEFKRTASAPDTIEYKIGEIFGEIKPKFQSGYSLRDALELMGKGGTDSGCGDRHRAV